MKFPRSKIVMGLLGLSIAGNAFLLAAILRTPSGSPAEQARAENPPDSRSPGAKAITPTAAPSGPKVSTTAKTKGLWAQLRTDDLKELVRRLQAAGFSRPAIQQIMHQLVTERFEPRWRELRGDVAELPYWKIRPPIYSDPKKAEQANALAQEQGKLVNELLGNQEWLETSLAHLPSDKITAVKAIRRDYSELMEEAGRAIQKSGRPPSAEDDRKMQLLQEEQRGDLARLLSPTELFEYDLRSSEAAYLLREQTKSFQTTEAEFRTLFPVYQAAMEKARVDAAVTGATPETRWRAAEGEMQAKLKELLGPERYADFVQAKDPASAKLNQIVQRLDLPLSAARAVVAVEKEITQRADAVKTNRSLTSDQRQEALATLAQEASERISGTLGSRGFGAYQQYSGKWLQALQPKTATKKP